MAAMMDDSRGPGGGLQVSNAPRRRGAGRELEPGGGQGGSMAAMAGGGMIAGHLDETQCCHCARRKDGLCFSTDGADTIPRA